MEFVMNFHINQQDLIFEIMTKLAKENNKSIERIKRLLLIKQNNAIIRRFWEILDEIMPRHNYNYFGCCAECGSMELREELPL
jgi:hypothetical protein